MYINFCCLKKWNIEKNLRKFSTTGFSIVHLCIFSRHSILWFYILLILEFLLLCVHIVQREYLFLIFQICARDYDWWIDVVRYYLRVENCEYERENERKKDRYETTSGKMNCLSILFRYKLNSVERDVNSRMNSFISWWKLDVLGPCAKVMPFHTLCFSAVVETRKLGCWHDSVDSLLQLRATYECGNHIFHHGFSISLWLQG